MFSNILATPSLTPSPLVTCWLANPPITIFTFWLFTFLLIKTMIIKETMEFFPIISKRDDGFGPKRWNFYELKVNRNVTSIRQVRVQVMNEY